MSIIPGVRDVSPAYAMPSCLFFFLPGVVFIHVATDCCLCGVFSRHTGIPFQNPNEQAQPLRRHNKTTPVDSRRFGCQLSSQYKTAEGFSKTLLGSYHVEELYAAHPEKSTQPDDHPTGFS